MHTVLTNIIIYLDTLLHALIILQNGLKLNLLHKSLLKVLHTSFYLLSQDLDAFKCAYLTRGVIL